jgi:MoxR-like ATPase
VLAHRLTLTPQAWAQGVEPARLVSNLVQTVAVPPSVAMRG